MSVSEQRAEQVWRPSVIPNINEDPVLNNIACNAADAAGTDVGLVTYLDDTTSWIIARTGWDVSHSRREAAFCAWALHNAEVMWVGDARLDARFQDNPFVFGEPYIRFYAGAPIDLGEGGRIGTVCVVATEPRPVNVMLCNRLKELAQLAAQHLQPALKAKQ